MQHRILAGTAIVFGALGTAAALATLPPPHRLPRTGVQPRSARTVAVVTIQSVPLSPYPLRCSVTASNVNYRRGPGTQYASYGAIGRGFAFASSGELPNPRGRYFHYWDNIQRPGHADAYINDQYVSCWVG